MALSVASTRWGNPLWILLQFGLKKKCRHVITAWLCSLRSLDISKLAGKTKTEKEAGSIN